jgi:ribonuclease P protein component
MVRAFFIGLRKGCLRDVLWKAPPWQGFGVRPYFCPMAKRFGFPKTERLKSRKQIDGLFEKGKGFGVFPLRVMYQFFPAETKQCGLQAGVTVSKRYFKKAVDRNRIKRLLREAYRLQKEELQAGLKASGRRGIVFFLYTDKTTASFDVVKAAMARCLKKLSVIATSENPS